MRSKKGCKMAPWRPLGGLWAASGRPLAAEAGFGVILGSMLAPLWASKSVENGA